MSRYVDLMGKSFGRLTVVANLPSNKWGNRTWLCLCSCGNRTVVAGGNLQCGNTKSCGCLRSDKAIETKTTHGHTRGKKPTVIYRSWREKDMSQDWKSGLTLERIDNELGYCKKNCRWATRKEQARNRRSSRLITCFGKTQTLAEWSEETDIQEDTISQRLIRGWDKETALTALIPKRE